MNWFSKLWGSAPAETDPTEGDMIVGSPEAPRDGGSQGADLPKFRSPAGRISRRFGGLGAQDTRALIRNAFTPSQPVNERAMFAGRRALLEDLIVAIEDQRLHFVLYGDRGIGKTSILHVLSDLATDADYMVCYISCGDRINFTDFARRVAQRIPLLFHRDHMPGSTEIEQGQNLADILPNGEVDVSTFGEILSRLSDTRIIMLLDEFDRVETDDFRRSIAELIKNLSDNSAPAQVVIAGVAPDLAGLISQIPSIRRNVLGVMVPNMTDDEVEEMLAIAERKAGLQFTEGARELIGIASLGLPYLVGLIGQHAALLAAQRDELSVTKADVREAISKARHELSGRIAAGSLHAISDAISNDLLIDSGKLAHAALRNGGLLSAEMAESDQFKSTFSAVSESALVEPVKDDPLGRWRFVDDGAATYIWLSALSAK